MLDLRNGSVSEFRPPLPADYVTVFQDETDAPEVRCDLTDRHTHTDDYSNPPAPFGPFIMYAFSLNYNHLSR